MSAEVIKSRLEKLREAMLEEKIDYYMIPTADYHSSEYVNDYFKVREYFSGFTGSNGTLVVWQKGAGLWTDGRYFIQAENELKGSDITLFRMQEEGVPSIEEFLEKELIKGQTLAFDGRVFSISDGKNFEKTAKSKEAKLRFDVDLSQKIWNDRPAFPKGEIFEIPENIAGKSAFDKLSQVRMQMERYDVQGVLLTKLDDIMWLFNIRGCDVECNPVAMSYAYISKEEAVLFIQKEALTTKARDYLLTLPIIVDDYFKAETYIKNLKNKRILLDKRYVNFKIYKLVSLDNTIVLEKNPTEQLKAVKNAVELRNMEKFYLLDSVAVTKFIYWLKKNITKQTITELSAAEYLDELRRKIPGFIDLSFPTISAYGPNAAMMHYEATKDSFATLKPEGMLLVDSGGQYMGATTDVTRTIALGPVADEIKKHYSLVAAGMLNLTKAHWLYGCTGRNLDILARRPLWEIGIDYKCGTGHGVGYILNVHEGPQGIRWRYNRNVEEAVIEEGMDVTNEPGVYVEGSHGIRIENVLVAQKDIHNEYGQFMHFETLTYVPIDMELIDEKYFSEVEKEWLFAYQKEVYEKISPFLEKEEEEWLRQVCKPFI